MFHVHDNTRYPLENLRYLEFKEDCMNDPPLLKDILASCPKLEVLVLQWDPLGDHYFFSESICVMDIWMALAEVRKTIREIRLEVRSYLPLGDGDRWSIQDFDKLQVLKVNGHAVSALLQNWKAMNPHMETQSFLQQFLPASIENFVLWDPDAAYIPDLSNLANSVSGGHYPRLKSITVDYNAIFQEISRVDIDATWTQFYDLVKESMMKAKVQLEVRYVLSSWPGGSYD
jgi:hypothetical protein